MELYGYTSHHYPPRSPPAGKMHSTISFPGSSGRRGSLPVVSSNFETLSPSSAASPRVPHTPLNFGPREPKTPVAVNGVRERRVDVSPKRQKGAVKATKPREKVAGPDAILSDLDMEADVRSLASTLDYADYQDIIDQLDGSLASSRPLLADRISQLIATHQAKVDEMEASATPWRDLAHREGISPIEEGSSDSGSAFNGDRDLPPPLVDVPTRRRTGEGDAAALARIEGWSEEVKNYLTSEIAVLRIEEAARTKGWMYYAFWIMVSVAVVLVTVTVVAMLWGPPATSLPAET